MSSNRCIAPLCISSREKKIMEKIRARENATAPGPGHRATGVERQVERQVLLLTALFVYTTAWRRKHRALTTPPPPFHTNLTGLHVDACLPRMNTLPANARLDRTVDTHMLTRHPTLPPPHWKHGAAPETQSSSSRRRRATVPQSDNFRHARHSSWQESNPRTHTMSSRVQWGLSRPCTCTSASSHVRV